MASELEHYAAAIASPAYRGQFRHLKEWIDLNAFAMQVCGELWDHKEVGEVSRVFSIVHSQWMALVRSAMSLNDQGRYGPAAGLVRTIYERTDLIAYFCHYPEEAINWSDATRTPPTDSRHRTARRTFAWSKIRKELRLAGLHSTSNKAIRELNNAVHPSEWGLRFYAIRRVPGSEMENVVGISPTVVFDLITAFWIGRLLHGVSPLPVQSFLRLLEAKKVRRSAWRALHSRYEKLMKVWETLSTVSNQFASIMNESERRVIAGEDFEQVRHDIETRIGFSTETDASNPK